MPRLNDLSIIAGVHAELLEATPFRTIVGVALLVFLVFALTRGGGEWLILIQALCRTRFVRARRTVWWYCNIGRKLSRLLILARLPAATRLRSLRFFAEHLVPLFGPTPPEFYAQANRGSYKPILRSPMELGWALGGGPSMCVRYGIEILDEGTGKPRDPGEVWDAAESVFSSAAARGDMPDLDLTWPAICYQVMVDHSWHKRYTDHHPIQFFVGGDMKTDGVTAKYYFYPRARGVTGDPEPPFNVVNDCLVRVGLAEQWQPVVDFFQANPKYCAEPEFIGVDGVSPANSRIKVYVRVHRDFSSLNEIRRITTLGGALASPTVLETIQHFERLWRLLYPDLRDDQVVHSVRPGLRGMLVYFEMGIGRPELIPKIYIPLYRFPGTDEHVARAITTYFRKYDQGGDVEKNYEQHFKSMFSDYDLNQKMPLIQSYLGITTKKGKTQLTMYLTMDLFHVAHT